MNIHIVQKGDTLWALSRKYGVSLNRIVEVNQLPYPNILLLGQALVIPTVATTHVVSSGESLWLISRRYNTTIQAIVEANNLTNINLIHVGQVLSIPSAAKPIKEVLAYIADLDRLGSTAQSIVQNLGGYLTYLCPASYEVRSDGSLINLEDQALISRAISEDILPCMVITNFLNKKVSTEIGHAILQNSAAQDILIENVLTTMNSKGYKGLQVNFETLLPEDRDAFNRFLEKVSSRLHSQGLFVSSALAPKVSATQKGLQYEAHDYAAHGKLMDFIVLMTYEWGWVGGPPSANSPISKIKEVLNYAVTEIPRQKIMMGTLFYARDWTLPYVQGSTYAKTMSSQDAVVLAVRYRTSIQYDNLAQSPFFRYKDEQGR
ncbi:MAG: spore gernimation protein, partial [Desulfosporosinus sp. BRH_c37]